MAAIALLVLACDPASQLADGGLGGDGDVDRDEPTPHAAPDLPTAPNGGPDLSGGALRVIEVPAASNLPALVATPDGYFALSQRFQDGKALAGGEAALYRSADGVQWSRVPLDRQDNSLLARGLAYGAGRYVVVGWRLSESGTVVLSSEDLLSWEEAVVELDASQRWGEVTFVGGRFFAFGARELGVSADGVSWQRVATGIVQPFGIAFGHGRYVLVGSGGVESSSDGLSWVAHPVDCQVPDACVTDPSGNRSPILFDVSFDGTRFVAGPLESADGQTWTPASGPPRGEPVGGYYFRVTSATELEASSADAGPWPVPVVRPTPAAVTLAGREDASIGVIARDAPLPDQLAVPFEDDLSCATAPCVIIGGRLYLAPPPGTPPLPDRVPRLSDGEPLLSDACPISTMITCDDYGARKGCVCDPSAPRAPRSCEHVGQFECLGRFVHQPGEWEVDEVGPAGCSCDHRDPDAPASFGLSCEADASRCESPMACMQVQSLESSCCGPPPPPPRICTMSCSSDSDCPSWEGTGYCSGPVVLRCQDGVCQQRTCAQ